MKVPVVPIITIRRPAARHSGGRHRAKQADFAEAAPKDSPLPPAIADPLVLAAARPLDRTAARQFLPGGRDRTTPFHRHALRTTSPHASLLRSPRRGGTTIGPSLAQRRQPMPPLTVFDTQVWRKLAMPRTRLSAALVAAISLAACLGAANAQAQAPTQAAIPAGLFSNYYVGPPGLPARMYVCPRPTPTFVGPHLVHLSAVRPARIFVRAQAGLHAFESRRHLDHHPRPLQPAHLVPLSGRSRTLCTPADRLLAKLPA